MSDLASNKGRYTVWIIDYYSEYIIDEIKDKGTYISNSKEYEDLEIIEYFSKNLFEKYKIFQPKPMLSDTLKVYISYRVIGKTSTRKRVSTLDKEHKKLQIDYDENDGSENNIKGYNLYNIPEIFEKATSDGYLISTSDSSSEYTGEDVNSLDDPKVRYPWQQELLNFFYDEKKEDFIEPNDRTIYWIYDPKGATGKSKFVKWICINRPEEVVKIIFGTAGQLRSALISAGSKKCYFVDMPRTLPTEDKLDSIMATIEDLKNGHLVSVMYGRYQQLVMQPPHVIIFSNKRCPRKMMSDDRWSAYEIKDGNLKESY